MSDSNTRPTIPIQIFENFTDASQFVAQKIVRLIQQKDAAGEKTVLGLATGNTPRTLYRELIKKYQQGEVSFKNVVTFNLDEYYPMQTDNPGSYHYFMKHELFDHIDIKCENCHVPKGDLPWEKIGPYCDWYEEKIKSYGGIDLQILGIGQNGHIGFNEPGSTKESITRLVNLEEQTRLVNSSEFEHIDQVPYQAITMGVQTILDAHEVILLANGEKKAKILAEVMANRMESSVPASFLHHHPRCIFMLDPTAASLL